MWLLNWIIEQIKRRKQVATEIHIGQVSFQNIKINGIIMATSLGQTQKVTGTVVGSNPTNTNAPISNIAAASSDTAILTIQNIDEANKSFDVFGVAPGSATVVVTAQNINGVTLTTTVDITITEDLVATVLTIVFGTPVNQ